MTNHLIAYVSWPIIGQWKRLLLKHAGGGIPWFVYGSNDDRQFERFAKDGAVLWLLASHRDLPPTLVARLAPVERLGREPHPEVPQDLVDELKPADDPAANYEFKVKGGRRSRFYGHNDASRALTELALVGNRDGLVKRAGEPWAPRRHGVLLQRPHRVQDPSPLDKLATDARARSLFISWKHSDVKGRRRRNIELRRKVIGFTRALNARSFAVWLDELALPNFHPNSPDDALLELLLRQGLRESRVVVAVASDHYGTVSPGKRVNWTKKELHSKRRPNRVGLLMDQAQGHETDRQGSGSSLGHETVGLLLAGEPDEAACEFCRWFERR
jgi:hypothetical protein